MNETPVAEVPARPVAVEDVTGQRIGAAIIDFVLLLVLGLVMALAVGDSESGNGGVNISLNGTPFVVYVLLCFAYFFALESFVGGQTIGKKLAGIRVVSTDGAAANPGMIAVRTAFRVIDGLPFILPYLVGFIVSATSKDKQRIGDMVAKTRVVSARR
jgi:uncharacterized RDD family membrane protein YckC